MSCPSLVLCSVLAAALAGAVPSIPALAATAPGTPAQTFAQPANAALHENAVEIHDFEQVPISLRQAITTAEAASRAKAVDARFAVENGAPFYDIKTFGNGALWEGRIDARTGQILGTPLTTPQARLSDGQLTQLHWLEDTGAMPLRRAVAIAEQQGGGKAINSVAISHQGKLAYATELVKNGTLERISIDPQKAGSLPVARFARVELKWDRAALCRPRRPPRCRTATAPTRASALRRPVLRSRTARRSSSGRRAQKPAGSSGCRSKPAL